MPGSQFHNLTGCADSGSGLKWFDWIHKSRVKWRRLLLHLARALWRPSSKSQLLSTESVSKKLLQRFLFNLYQNVCCKYYICHLIIHRAFACLIRESLDKHRALIMQSRFLFCERGYWLRSHLRVLGTWKSSMSSPMLKIFFSTRWTVSTLLLFFTARLAKYSLSLCLFFSHEI